MGLGRTKAIPTLAVTDLEQARDFYGTKLGFDEIEPTDTGERAAAYDLGEGSYLYVYERPTPSGSTATACEFAVEDVEGSVDWLRGRGISFEEYDLPEMGLRTRNGIAAMQGGVKAAWFKDPFGNILAISNSLYATAQRGKPERGVERGEEPPPMHA